MNLFEDWKYEHRDLPNESFDDWVIKKKVVEIAPQLLGLTLKINENNDGKGIDLICVDNPEIGVEVERGGWFGDFWKDLYYSTEVMKWGFPTLNMPDRKLKYWMEQYLWRKQIIKNPGFKNTIFVRSSWELLQMNVVRPETVLNPNKIFQKREKVKNNTKIEGWVSFKHEDVESYNFYNGLYILESKENGEYPELSKERRRELEIEKREAEELVEVEKRRRSIEVFKKSKIK
jgi:hypothetical protein